jgi:hypothetical protein
MRHWGVAVVVGCLALCPPALAQSSVSATPQRAATSSALRAMTVDDVLKMVEVKLGDDLIISQIRKSGTPFALSADDLVRLKSKGVSDAIIRVMIDPRTPAEPATSRKIADTKPLAADRPDTDTAKEALQSTITGPLAGKLRLVDFRKTDGQSREVMGVQMYAFEFSAMVDFLDDMLCEMSDNAIKTSPPGTTLNDNRGFSWDAWFNTAVAGRKPAYMGDRLNLVGTVHYQRKESGWVVASIEFKGTMDPSHRAAGHGVGDSGSGQAIQPAGELPRTPSYPISSGRVTSTRVRVVNDNFSPIMVFFDGASDPVSFKGSWLNDYSWEVGSKHLINAVVGRQTFQVEYTVPQVGGELRITSRGITIGR